MAQALSSRTTVRTDVTPEQRDRKAA